MQWQSTVILEQHNGLTRSLESQLPVRGRIIFAYRNVVVGILARRVKHAELKTRGEEPRERAVDIGFRNEALFHRLAERMVRAAAVQIVASLQCVGGVRVVRRVMMAARNVGHSVAIGDHIAIELPIVAQVLLKQHGVGAVRRAIDGAVGAHHGIGVPFDNRCANSGKDLRRRSPCRVPSGDRGRC